MKRIVALLLILLPCIVRADETFHNVPTSQKYVDGETAKLQPAFDGLGENKLMTYGTTDGVISARDIVTSLGTSTTDTTVPTRGAINAGLNAIQYKLNGNAGWVVTNTGINGLVGQKPVYNATNNYNTALVDAETLNNAVINAVNSELIQIDETGAPNPNGTLWKLNDVTNLTLLDTRDILDVSSLDTSLKGSAYCYRNLDGSNRDGYCDEITLNMIGAPDSKSNMWAVLFAYGAIIGKSVCSSQNGTYATVATAEQNTALNTEYITQAGNGNVEPDQMNCWCKMDALNTQYVTTSLWVFHSSMDTASCVGSCSFSCAGSLALYTRVRSAIFSAVIQ